MLWTFNLYLFCLCHRKYVNRESKSSSLTRSPSLISIMPPTATIAKLLLSTEKWHIQAE